MKNIVVFDPDLRSAEELGRLFVRLGYSVEATDDAPTALAVVRCTTPDLFVAAVDDRERLGLGVVRTVLVRAPLVPVLAVGAVEWGCEDVLHTALRLGASDTLLKPLSEERLVRRTALLVPLDTPGAGIASPVTIDAAQLTADVPRVPRESLDF